MTGIADGSRADNPAVAQIIPAALFALTVFASAVLVFLVEPMVARLVLPLLGGSAAVWNTSLAFFQIALLAGYIYAHLLQRIRRIKFQVIIHLAVMIAAGFALPLHVAAILGEPSSTAPVLWLLGVLTVSLGAPFVALSATAPLVQAWYAGVMRHEGAREPYVLYAASNLGSLIALVAYPAAVEPGLRLQTQTAIWSGAYGAFTVLIAILGAAVWRASQRGDQGTAPVLTATGTSSVREKLIWVALAAVPSSLMLGVTNFVTTELGSAPFLWVVPLALYLGTFIIAFHDRQVIRPQIVLFLQAAILTLCGLVFWISAFLPELGIHLLCFFLTALVCHQALVARRPPADRLTDFYIWMGFGGVVGGAFNAFIAPLIFNHVIEYPAVLILSCLARPWKRGPLGIRLWAVCAISLSCAVIAAQVIPRMVQPASLAAQISFALLCVTAIGAFLLRGRPGLFMVAIFALVTAGASIFDRRESVQNWRDFFGVLSLSQMQVDGLGDVKMLRHGTTLHGAQSSLPAMHCRPLAYYAPETPIGQVFEDVRQRKQAINVGAVGLGTGSVAAYTRPGDALRFFEIDPAVISVSTNPKYFSYTTQCAGGRISYTLGDARLTLAKQPSGEYDILLIDAFSSDSVPAHLLTVEAVRMYLSKLNADGVLILHLSNRHLDLMRPAMAAAHAAGGFALQQIFRPKANISASREQAVIIAKSRAALAPFLGNPRWSKADAQGVEPWTDDYTNIFGALIRRSFEHADAGN